MRHSRSTAKARIFGEPMMVRRLLKHRRSLWGPRGGYREFDTITYWRYTVTDSSGKVVLTDGCRDYATVLEDAVSGVAAVRRLENAGHEIRHSFDDLVGNR